MLRIITLSVSLIALAFSAPTRSSLAANLVFEGPLVAPEAKDQYSDQRLVITLPGMGTAFSWNIGSVHAMYEALDLVRQNQVIFAGDSGGAVPALYFSCRGLSPESIRDAERLVIKFRPEISNEDKYSKLIKLFLKVATEFPDTELMEHIAEVIPDGCRPNLPFIIPVGNSEVIERRLAIWPQSDLDLFSLAKLPFKARPPRTLVGTRVLKHRQMDPFTYWVNETDDHGTPIKHIGKACTYLVSPSIFEVLRKVDEEDRLCDLRLIEDAEDMRVAMRWAVGETTYNDPLGENPKYFQEKNISQQSLVDQGKLLISKAQLAYAPFERLYNGGLIMPGSVVREFIRMNKDFRVLSSGRPYFYDPTVTRKFTISNPMREMIQKLNPEYAAYLRQKTDPMGKPLADRKGEPLWGLPPDGEALFLRGWYGFDVNQLIYLDQGLADLVVPVDPDLKSAERRTGKERRADLPDEIKQGHDSTWACFERKAQCLPPKPGPKLPPQIENSDPDANVVRIPPAPSGYEGELRPKDWRPRLDFKIQRETVAFPWNE